MPRGIETRGPIPPRATCPRLLQRGLLNTVAKAPREPGVSALTAKSRRNYGSRRTCRYGVNSRNAPTDLKFPCLLHPGWRAPAVLRPPLNP